jgi:ketosteroid isomerase-like protein
MKTLHLAAALVIAASLQAPLVGPVCARAPAASSPQSALDELLATDRAFSDLASRTSVGTALAAMLDDDVIMPLPTGTFARGRADALNAVASTGRAFATRAEWTPVRGGLSADGRHGFTWGYATMRGADGSVRPGKYLSYWVRRPEGWRVAFYRRAGRPEGEVPTGMLAPALPQRLVPGRRDRAAQRGDAHSLDAAERAFSDDAQRIGIGPAFARWGRADSANMGRNAAFTIGAVEIAAGQPQSPPSAVSWAPEGTLVASSGDLGVTWGWIRPNGPPRAGQPAAFPYFTVWRRGSRGEPWRYVAE